MDAQAAAAAGTPAPSAAPVQPAETSSAAAPPTEETPVVTKE